MTDREKVIKGLEQFITDFKPFCGNKADWQRVDDALALLKAQEPRVMTLEEVKAYKVGEPLFYECKVIYPCWVIRYKDRNERIHFISYVGNIFKDISEYGIRWRCWTSRPTDEQMEATPWNAQK